MVGVRSKEARPVLWPCLIHPAFTQSADGFVSEQWFAAVPRLWPRLARWPGFGPELVGPPLAHTNPQPSSRRPRAVLRWLRPGSLVPTPQSIRQTHRASAQSSFREVGAFRLSTLSRPVEGNGGEPAARS
jgi:hypothetical protein